MRLKSVWISNYKNLRGFNLEFAGNSLINVFVGKNGAGKSNFFEALLAAFRHIVEFDSSPPPPPFDYNLSYDIDGKTVEIEWKAGRLAINGKSRRTVGTRTPLPDNFLIYYSGHNQFVNDIVDAYESTFRERIKSAKFSESRRFIGIGPDYKTLLLAVLLMQPEGCSARRYICEKLAIDSTAEEIRLIFSRPYYAGSERFNITDPEVDRFWKPEGITKSFLERLMRCVSTAKGGRVRDEGYFPENEEFIYYFDIAKLRREFSDLTPQQLFRQLDNLKTLGLLAQTSMALTLCGGAEISIEQFSDGQFQSVYIYAVSELFKDRNCVALLDEPDCFQHPEWQFHFLEQIVEITGEAAATNHVLMSSHSASTVTTVKDELITLFELHGNRVTVQPVSRADVVKSLSAGLITYSETEARLSIQRQLMHTDGHVLFTEGITDELILETAWQKLHATESRHFAIQSAHCCSFMRILMNDDSLYTSSPQRKFFALFDFDSAYNDWCQIGNDVELDPGKCLTRKHIQHDGYAMLLPVPARGDIRKQVINPSTNSNYGGNARLNIELMFHGITGLDTYFQTDDSTPGDIIEFRGDKVHFAKTVVPSLDASHFEPFRPIFDFVQATCSA